MALSKTQKTSLMLGFLGVGLVVIDQVSKVLVKTNMSLGECIPVLGDWFKICFVENEGMAFGMAFGGAVGKFVLSTLRIVLFGAIVWWICGLIKKEDIPKGVLVGIVLIAAGAFGNLIDGLFYGLVWDYAPFMFGKVVDMLYFPLIDTYIGNYHFTFFDPVFNFADSCVCVGAFYLAVFQFKFLKKL